MMNDEGEMMNENSGSHIPVMAYRSSPIIRQ
jgi:hypothetical protein